MPCSCSSSSSSSNIPVVLTTLSNVLSKPEVSKIAQILSNNQDILQAIQNVKNSTINLPSNDAVAQVGSVIETLSQDQIRDILKYHVAQGTTTNGIAVPFCTLLPGKSVTMSATFINNKTRVLKKWTLENGNTVNLISNVLLPEGSERPECL